MTFLRQKWFRDAPLPYRSLEIRVYDCLSVAPVSLAWATSTLLFSNFHACKSDSDPVYNCGDIGNF